MSAYFRKYWFAATVCLFICFATAASYYRFMISYDYLIQYEGACDPVAESCFVYCETDSCEDPVYYTWIIRPAYEISSNCGDDVTLCDYAYECPVESDCTIEYCIPNDIDECDDIISNMANQQQDNS